MSRLAPATGGAAAVDGRAFVLFDAKGERVAEQDLAKTAEALARFGDEWLVLAPGQKHLVRVSAGARPAAFGAGKGAIGAFGVGRDDAVVVARGDTLELWSRDDERRWSAKGGGPFSQAVVARDHVVALAEDGALVFFSRDGGDPLGALRLASPEPTTAWRLVHVDGAIVVLALGEWLVWIDASTRKTVRRVRAKAKVVAVAADGQHVAAAIEDGCVQSFKASTGEPRASIAIDGVACAITLCPDALFTMGESGLDAVRACDRQTLDAATRAVAPVSAIAARGKLAAVADKTGRARVVEVLAEPRELAAFAVGEGTLGVHVTSKDAVVAAGPRVIMRVAKPWSADVPPRPVALKSPPTAFAADDSYAFVGGQSGGVDVYDLDAGRPVTSYALSSDDRITALVRLAGPLLVVGTGALDGRVLFVDVVEAKVVHRLEPHEEAFGVTCLAADARGRIVASGSDDGSIALLDPGKGRLLAKIRVTETPTAIAFEPTGRRLACVFADGTASIVTLAAKGATLSDLGLRGATQVAWGESLVFGFKDGHVESGERHARPSDRPAATRH